MSPNVGLGTEEGTRGWDLYITSIVMVLLAGAFVIGRIVQRSLSRAIGVDDYLIVASLISSAILSVTEIQAVVNGYGQRYEKLTLEQATSARRWFYGAQIAYKIVLMLNKMSICFMYYRIFSISSKGFRWCCHVMQGVLISSGIAFVGGTIFQCRPIAAFWDKEIEGSWCIAQTPWWMTYAILQILLDVLLVFLPIYESLQLTITRLEKIGLILVFCTGLFVTFTSIYRATTLASSATNPDPTYGPIPATVWAVIEANSGIIAACLPLLRRPFVKIFGRFFSTTNRETEPDGSLQAPGSYRLSSRSRGVWSVKKTVAITQSRGDSQERIVGKRDEIGITTDAVAYAASIGTKDGEGGGAR